MSDLGQVIVPLAAGGVSPGGQVMSVLVMGGTQDAVVPYAQQLDGFEASPSPKRLVGIENAGHLAFAQLCSLRNAAGEDLVTVAKEAGICGAAAAGALFQCDEALLPDAEGWAIVDHVTTAVLEESLHCRDHAAAFNDLQQRFAAVAEYREG